MSKKLQKKTAENDLFAKVAELIELSRQKVATAVNLAMVHTYFEISKMIVEDEQQGEERAEYGKKVLKELSEKLTEKFGKGFSARNLRNMRQFYLTYSERDFPIWQKASAKSQPFTLSWSHYLILMRIENVEARKFYEIEAIQQQWSEPQLGRQCDSSLYERLALSRDKDAVMRLANKGQIIKKPEDVLKNPLTLEFLGLDEKSSYSESDLESAIISKLQNFLLEIWCFIIACCNVTF
jgi:predicted nuclease of restriction endonuclease-like (RecB) superfamily